MLRLRDIVQLNKGDQDWIMQAEVIHVPEGPGDVWGFKDLVKNRQVYTSETFTAYMIKDSRRPSLPPGRRW